MTIRKVLAGFLAAFCLVLCSACIERARSAIPFLPPSKYVDVGGRKLTRAEVAYFQKIKDLSYATKVNPRDAVAFNAIGELFQKKGNYSLAKELYLKAIGIDDTLSEAHHNLGLIYIYEDRYTGALDELGKAKLLSPDDARIRHRLGMAKAGMGKKAEALKEYDEAVALDAEYTPAYLEKGKLLYSMRRYQEATVACRAALAHIPKVDTTTVAKETRGSGILDAILPSATDEEAPRTWRQEAAYDLALCLKAQGQFSEALTTLVQSEDALEAKLDVQMLKARLQEATNDTTGGIATLTAMKEQFPTNAEVVKRLAKLYQKNGQADLAAKARLEASELDQSDRELQEEAARDAEQKKDTARAIAIYERLVRIEPEELRYRRQLAKAYDNAGIYRQAALAYQEIVNRAPEDYATRRRVAILFSELPGFQGRAILAFKQVLEKSPDDAEVHRRLGELYLGTRNFVEAEKHIRDTLRVAPNDASAQQNLATLYVNQNRFDDAVAGYKRALQLNPKLDKAQLNLGRVLVGLGRREEAVAPLRDYLKLKPLDEEARRLLADALRDLGKKEDAIQEYEALDALRPNDPGSKMNLAQLSKGLGKPRSAVGIYEQIIEKNPSDLAALKEAGRLYMEMNMPLRAIFCWQRVLSLKPTDLEGQKRLADCYHSINSDEAAIKAYETVGKNGDAEAWKSAAFLHIKRNERDPALQALREAIKINPQERESRQQLAGMLQTSDKPEERDEALRLNEELVQLDPKDLMAHLNMANLLSENNRLSEAQDQYELIAREKADYSQALVGLGVIARKRGKYDSAADYYSKALVAEGGKTPPDKRVLRTAHLNMGIIYDFYLKNADKAQAHYRQYIDNGGDPKKLPTGGKAPEAGKASPAADDEAASK